MKQRLLAIAGRVMQAAREAASDEQSRTLLNDARELERIAEDAICS